MKAIPVAGEIFADSTPPFVLRDTWSIPPPAGANTEAFFDGDRTRAALSWKPFGKGKVVVIWASTIVPPTVGKAHGGVQPLLRDIARWAGVRLYTDATIPHLWTNLLKQKTQGMYYGLVYHSVVWDEDLPAETGTVTWTLPDGKYNITELISGKTVGIMSGNELREKGLTLTLDKWGVAIYRMAIVR